MILCPPRPLAALHDSIVALAVTLGLIVFIVLDVRSLPLVLAVVLGSGVAGLFAFVLGLLVSWCRFRSW